MTCLLQEGEDNTTEKSGNPGYVVGQPLLAGNVTTETDESGDERYVRRPRPGSHGSRHAQRCVVKTRNASRVSRHRQPLRTELPGAHGSHSAAVNNDLCPGLSSVAQYSEKQLVFRLLCINLSLLNFGCTEH